MLIVGCGSDSTDTTAPTVLEGAWNDPCYADQNGDSHLQTTTYSGNSAKIIENVYFENLDCSGTLGMENTSNFSFSIGSETTSTNAGEASQVDVTIQNIFIKVVDSNAIANFNSNMICGFADWAVNVSKNANGLQCNPNDQTDFIPALGDKIYDIFLISNNGNSLNFGDSDSDPNYDGSTALKRPINLDTVTSIKQ